jgi:hypothetical protein
MKWYVLAAAAFYVRIAVGSIPGVSVRRGSRPARVS